VLQAALPWFRTGGSIEGSIDGLPDPKRILEPCATKIPRSGLVQWLPCGAPHGSHFCELYRAWLKKQDWVLRQDHRAGEKLFVDYAGDTIPIWNPENSEVAFRAAIFVAAMGASSYTFAEATESQELRCWIGSHLRAFDFLGGVPEILVPDNTKTGVIKACRYEPDLNPTYRDMAEHYGVAVVPARPYKPRDKAKVEVGVQVVQRWIVAAVRKRKFFSLDELNLAIEELLTTDLRSSLKQLLQIYFDRWQIEVNHREERDTLGIGQAQLWNVTSVPKPPVLGVAAYSALLLASLQAFGPERGIAYAQLPQWRRNARRPSCLDLVTLLRKEMAQHPQLLAPFGFKITDEALVDAAAA
jgi:hypothetical protein